MYFPTRLTGWLIRQICSLHLQTQSSNTFHASNDDQPKSISSMTVVHSEPLLCVLRRLVFRQVHMAESQATACPFERPPINSNRRTELNNVKRALISTQKQLHIHKYFSKTNKIFRLRNWIRHGGLILQTHNSTKLKE